MSKGLPIQAIDFTNSLGHIVKPGDKVIAISAGYNHSVKIREAEYIGCRVKNGKVQSVTVRSSFKNQRYNHDKGRYEQVEHLRLSTLPACRIYPLKVCENNA